MSQSPEAARITRAPTTHCLCWYCTKQLPAHFTSVRKNGQRLNVHYGCALPAERLIAGVLVEDQPDTFERTSVDFERVPF